MNIFDLQATISLNGDSFMQGVSQAQGAFSGLGSSISAGAVAIGNLASSAISKAASGVVDFGKDAIQTGMSFDTGMSQVAATLGMTMDDISNNVGGAGDTFNALKTTAAAMGRETVYSAAEAAEGLNILAMSGFSAQDSISMVGDVLHLAAAGSMDMASAAGYISGTMKGFNDETKDSGYYADLMAKGATLANTSVSQLGEAMSSGAAGAASYSQSAESMTVALLRLAEQGEVGSAAGTALSAAMKSLYTPTDQARDALAELGIAAYDETGKARDFNAIVNELSESLSGFTEEEANNYKQTIFSIQGLNAYNKMTVTGVQRQNEWAEALAGASDGIGEAAQQYATMTDNLEGAKAGLDSALDGFKNAVYEKIKDPLKEAANTAADVMNRITAGFEEGGFKGALSALGSFAKETLANIWDGLNLPPWVKQIPATLKSVFSKVKTSLDKLDLGGKFSGAVEQIKEAFDKIKEAFDKFEVGDKLKAVGDKIKAAFEKIKSVISGFNISEALSGLSEKLKSGFEKVRANIQNALEALFANETFQNVTENIKVIGESVVFAFKEAFNGDGFSGIISELSSFFGNVFGYMLENLHLPPGVYDAIISIQLSISNAFGKIKETVSNLDFSEAFGGIRDKVSEAFGNIRDAFQSIDFGAVFSGIGEKISGAVAQIKPQIEEKIQTIKDVFADVKTFFSDFSSGFSASFDVGVFSTLGGAITEFAGAFGALKDIKFDVITSGIKDFTSAFDGVDIGSAVGEIAGKVLELAAAFASASADVINGVTGAVTGFLDSFAESDIFDSIGKLGENVGSFLGAFLTASADTISSIAGSVKEFLDAFGESDVGEIIGDIAAKAADLFSDFLIAGESVIKGVADGIKKFFDVFDETKAVEAIESVAGLIAELFEPFTAALGSAIKSAGEGLGDVASNIGELAGHLANGIADTIKDIADSFEKWAPWVAAVASALATMTVISEIVPMILTLKTVLVDGPSLIETVSTALSALGTVMSSLGGPIGIAITAAVALTTALATAYATNEDFRNSIDGAVKAIGDGVRAAASAVASFVTETLPEAFSAFVDWIWELNDKIGSFFTEELPAKFDELVNILGRVVDKMKDVGRNIVEGIKQGILGAWDSMVSWFTSQCSNLVDSVLGFFGIHSPSTVFAGIGKNLVAGMEVGWGREFGVLERQVEQDLDTLTDTTRMKFADSAIGRSSAASISSNMALYGQRGGDSVEINLVLDGDVAARALYDPLRRAEAQKGMRKEAAYA